jgi:hypothetical protein
LPRIDKAGGSDITIRSRKDDLDRDKKLDILLKNKAGVD